MSSEKIFVWATITNNQKFLISYLNKDNSLPSFNILILTISCEKRYFIYTNKGISNL